MRHLKRLVLLVWVASLVVAVTITTAATPDPRLEKCGDGYAGNSASLSFAIPDVSRIWDHLPAMKLAPELATNSGPAFVVLFDDYTGLGMSGPITATNVVCIVDAAGQVNVYANVSKTGLRRP